MAITRVKSLCEKTENLELRSEVPWYMLFADDIELIGESLKEINGRLEERREPLNGKD